MKIGGLQGCNSKEDLKSSGWTATNEVTFLCF